MNPRHLLLGTLLSLATAPACAGAIAVTDSSVHAQDVSTSTPLAPQVGCPADSTLVLRAFDNTLDPETRAAAVRAVASCADPAYGGMLATLSENDAPAVRSQALRGLVLLKAQTHDQIVRAHQQSRQAVGGALIESLEQRADAVAMELLEITAGSRKAAAAVRREAHEALLRMAPDLAPSTKPVSRGWMLNSLAGATSGGLVLATLGSLRERDALPPLGLVTGSLIGGTAGYFVTRRWDLSLQDGFRIASYTGIGFGSGMALGRGHGNDRWTEIRGDSNWGHNYIRANYVRQKWSYGISAIGSVAGTALGLADYKFTSSNRIGLVDTSAIFGLVTGLGAAQTATLSGTERGAIVGAAMLGGALWARSWSDVGSQDSSFGLVTALPLPVGLTASLLHRAGTKTMENPGAWGTVWGGAAGLGAVALSRYDLLDAGDGVAILLGSSYGTVLGSGIGLFVTKPGEARPVAGIAAGGSIAGAASAVALHRLGLVSHGAGAGLVLGTVFGTYHGAAMSAALSNNSRNERAFGGMWLTNISVLGIGGYALGHTSDMTNTQALSMALASGAGSVLGTQIANAGGGSGQPIWIGSIAGSDVAILGVGIAVLAADVEPLYATLGASLGLAGAGLGAFTALYAAPTPNGETLSTGTAIGLAVGAGAGVATARAILHRRQTKPTEPTEGSGFKLGAAYRFARLEPLTIAAQQPGADAPMGLQIVFAETVH